MTHDRHPVASTATIGVCAARLRAIWFMAGCLVLPATAGAQPVPDEAAQRERIALERREADAELELRRWECSRRFVVTACQDKARSEHRDTVEALARAEEVLNSLERQARADRRLELIREKTQAFASLSPVPAAAQEAPLSQSAKPPVPGAGGNAVPAATTARQTDRTEADRAAARRAAASQLRREEAARERAQRATRRAAEKQPVSGLPTRPPIPPASAQVVPPAKAPTNAPADAQPNGPRQ